ncbi:MAG: hypothetical protein J4F33_08145 [Alphaproteobacteria bacterium]|nr:hypothetical protein [Alphaproteobacteria bacterium]
MTDIQRIAGKISHRCWGSAFKDLVFAVGMTDDFGLPFRELPGVGRVVAIYQMVLLTLPGRPASSQLSP